MSCNRAAWPRSVGFLSFKIPSTLCHSPFPSRDIYTYCIASFTVAQTGSFTPSVSCHSPLLSLGHSLLPSCVIHRCSAWVIHPFCLMSRPVLSRGATRGSPLQSVIGIKTTPNYVILRCFLATGTLYLLPKSLRQKYNGLTRQCQGTQLIHCIFAVGILAANTRSRLLENI